MENTDIGTESNNSDTNNSISDLMEKIENLEKQLASARNKVRELQNKNNQLRSRLNTSVSHVGTVEEVLEDGIIIKQEGSNQIYKIDNYNGIDLRPGDRVELNNNTLAIQGKLEQETDHRTRGMELDTDPDVTFEDIGGLSEEIREVRETVEKPLKNPEAFSNIGVSPPTGVLLYGEPGTGKTMIAKAVANNADATFLKLAASELVQKYIGEGARLVRDLFKVANENKPSIIFIDEIDAIASERKDTAENSQAEVQRTLMQLFSEMDGFKENQDVRVIGATNRYDMLDDAITRPGRFDRIVNISKPDEEGRKEIFEIHMRNMNIDDSVSVDTLVTMTEDFSGAEIQSVCTEAGMLAVRNDKDTITIDEFTNSINKVRKSREVSTDEMDTVTRSFR